MGTKEGYRWRPRHWAPNGRQQAILDALVQGKTNSEIGGLLGISVDGVKWYVSELLQETGLTNRRELANWWTRREDEIAAALPFKGPTMLLQSELLNQSWMSTDGQQAEHNDLAPRGGP